MTAPHWPRAASPFPHWHPLCLQRPDLGACRPRRPQVGPGRGFTGKPVGAEQHPGAAHNCSKTGGWTDHITVKTTKPEYLQGSGGQTQKTKCPLKSTGSQPRKGLRNRGLAARCPHPSPPQLASGDRTHQAARAINPPLRLTQRPCPGPQTPCPCPGRDFSVLLLGQMTMSLTPIHVTGNLGAVWGEGTKPPTSQGSLGGLNGRLPDESQAQRWADTACASTAACAGQDQRASTRPQALLGSCHPGNADTTHTSNRHAWSQGTQSCWEGDTRTGKSQGSATLLENRTQRGHPAQSPWRTFCEVPWTPEEA